MDIKSILVTLVAILGSVGCIWSAVDGIKKGHISYRSKKFFGGRETVYIYRKGGKCDLVLYCLFIFYYCVGGIFLALLAGYPIIKYL